MSEVIKKEKKKSSIASVFVKEYKYEWVVLLVLSLIAIILGVVFLNNEFGWTLENVYLIGDYPKLFSWILIGLGVLSLILSVAPIYKPSIVEIKRVSWPKRGEMVKSSIVVLIFSLAMALFFFIVDMGLNVIEEWLNK